MDLIRNDVTCKNGCDSVGTLYRVALGEVAFSYHSINLQQQGARYGVLTYLQGICIVLYPYENLSLVCLVGLFPFAKLHYLHFQQLHVVKAANRAYSFFIMRENHQGRRNTFKVGVLQ